ncbi:aldo/keto reductase family oxidoreductase [Erwinia sp.]|uniref:aldo/keto reductase family oxidoreductase n=1 Tax=Erwinia citreus TaxID=558 RepID=UPI003C72AF1D
MSEHSLSYPLAGRQINRMGYGAMQLAGPGVFGPPADEQAAIAVLRAAVEAGVTMIDTSDFYGPHITNQLIKRALHPYPEALCIVTKVGCLRDEKGGWRPAFSADELARAVDDNLKNLGLDVLEVVNLRSMLNVHHPQEGSLEVPLRALIKLKEQGLIRHIGMSNVTAKQVADAQDITPIVCVQNLYNLANRQDDELVDRLAAQGIAYVPFFPLGGFSPLQSTALTEVAESLQATPMQVALAWLLQRSPNIMLIPGTSSVSHFHENRLAKDLKLPAEALEKLNGIGA